MVADSVPKIQTCLLRWPVLRQTRSFRVFVVEPQRYEPSKHSQIFDAAIDTLVRADRGRIDPYDYDVKISDRENFDLITFPEAFLPKDVLLRVLQQILQLGPIGCVHVGLRPSTSEPHLFHLQQLKDLHKSIRSIPGVHHPDLEAFETWLNGEEDTLPYNVGCLFMVDAENHIRICLHPKMVRSKFERSALEEAHMKEANLVSLVTLLPVNKSFLSVTIQPLICSDALHIPTEQQQWPLDAVNAEASCFSDMLPDHVDIVSIANCTPQQQARVSSDAIEGIWHDEFRQSFRRMAADPSLSRHHYSAVVMSNFTMCPPSSSGGLSGAFVPVPFPGTGFPPYVSIMAWGREKEIKNSQKTWAPVWIDETPAKDWTTLGYVASLRTNPDDLVPAYMLGFTVDRLPRDTSRWDAPGGLVAFQRRRAEDINGVLKFHREGGR